MTEGILPARFRNTTGYEPVGEIVELGQNVTTRKVGDRVDVPWVQLTCGRCEGCQRGKSLFCLEQIGTGVKIAGGHAEYMVAYADAKQLLPERLEYEKAAPILCRILSTGA
jgi:alcohol dehydrogenase